MPSFASFLATLPPSADALSAIWHLSFTRLCADSRQVREGDGFVLLKSQTPQAVFDSKKIQGYLQAVQNQAVFVLTEIDPSMIGADFMATYPVPVVYLPRLRDFLGELMHASLFGVADNVPQVVAVTGTNGKTTTCQLVVQLLHLTGLRVAVLGTAGNGVLPNLVPSSHTTLQVMDLHQALYDFKEAKVIALEASSHGLHQQRLQGVPVTVAIFTNLSHEHLDYHPTMAEYANSKARLFDKAEFTKLTHAIINLDDPYSPQMQARAAASGLVVWTYSLDNPKADFVVTEATPSLHGAHLILQTPQGAMSVTSPLLGRFNIANLLASIAAALALGATLSELTCAIPRLVGASGRMQRIDSQAGCFMVDYAHTPDALAQVLQSLKAHCTGRLWVVFGCGGDRDKTKRPLMTQIALNTADCVVLTSDNPRTESIMAILADMQQGMSPSDYDKTTIEPDRALAIGYAVANAEPNDIVVVAGKGHETYQEIDGVRYDFDDRMVLAQALMAKGWQSSSTDK